MSQGEAIKLSKIFIFAGTTEGRELSEYLCAKKIEHDVCVATEYGEIVLNESPYAIVHSGRLNSDEMRQLFKEEKCEIVVDATHPYATAVTENIKNAAVNIKYLRLKRDTDILTDYANIKYFPDNETCAKALENTDGNILLTTGSKELSVYCKEQSVKERLFVRVLPGIESIGICMQNDIVGKHILALQGPFSTMLNEAIIDQYNIKCLVTKQSGATGGWNEKINAAKNKGIPVYVVSPNGQDIGLSFEKVCEYFDAEFAESVRTINNQKKADNETAKIKFNIILAGIGVGNKEFLTHAVEKTIKSADILFGAERMIQKYDAKIDKKPYYLADQIIPYLHNFRENKDKFITENSINKLNVLILFSGDTGFYSGSQKLYTAIKSEIEKGKLDATISVLPGISSVSYMASAIGESYNDAYICSIHGVKLSNIASRISQHSKTYMLMSGVKDVNMIGKLFSQDEIYGLNNSTIIAGYQLSYPEEKIMSLSPEECMRLKQDGLYICMIKNNNPITKNITPHINDTDFLREKVPMTKEEIRHISICKLHLKSDSILYDVGSGTGSIAIEAASLSNDIEVYAIEQKFNAVQLIIRNKEKFALDNIHVISAKAPDGIDNLPTPTHAFIGGSGGNLKEIIEYLRIKNPHIRIVINAISIETICEIKEILSSCDINNADIVQMQISRSNQIGNYHLMQAENPIWICSFEF